MIARQPSSLARRLRLVVFPRGSVRERVAFLMKVSVLEARHGPRAWWTAVRTAGRLLLPRVPAPRAAPPHGLDTEPQAAPTVCSGLPRQFAGEVPGLVSVVLPVYNQASLLGDAIASVLAQTYTNLELIVLSDGSTDGVEAVFDRCADDPRVRFLVQANQKLPRALSNGFDFARGEFWTWTSADNLMEPRHLEREVEFLRSHPDIDFVYADYIAIDDRGEPLRDPAFRPHNRSSPDSPDIHLPRDLTDYNDRDDNFIGPCFMYRGSSGQLLGDYAPELGVEDYDYWLRMNTVMRIAHLGTDELLYRYRVHDNSLCAQAVELGIHSRKDRLVALDRRRRAALALGWRVEVAPELAALRQPTPSDGATQHTVHLVPAAALAQQPPTPGSRVIAWFDGRDPEAPYRLRQMVDVAQACVSSDPTTADRLALFTGSAFVVPPEHAVGFAELHAKNRFLREFEQSTEQRRRVPPRVRLPHGRKLRVLLQVDDFAQGGLEQVVLDLAITLRQSDCQVQLLVIGSAGDAAARATALGLPVVQLDRARQREHYQQLLRAGCDVVNAHYSTFGAELAAAAKVSFVQTVHNTYVWMNGTQIEALRRSVPATAAFVCVSAEAARYSDVVLGIPPSKLIVLANGVEIGPPVAATTSRQQLRAQLGLAPDDFAFLQVASIYPPKAQRVAAQALHALRTTHPRAKLLCAGRTLDAAYGAQLQADLDRLGLGGAVRLLGFRPDVAQLLGAADAFLLPSYWEGWSLAVAEAAVAGLPLVLAEVGAAREQVAIAGGRLVPPPFTSITELRGDNLGAWVHTVQPQFVSALAAAMRDALDGRVPRPDVAACRREFDRQRALRQHVRLFTWLAAGGALASARAWLRNHEPLTSA
jgi:glycosyltransferase involved in cell wall biosynthesis